MAPRSEAILGKDEEEEMKRVKAPEKLDGHLASAHLPTPSISFCVCVCVYVCV